MLIRSTNPARRANYRRAAPNDFLPPGACQSGALWIAVFYAGVCLWTVLHHEPWRDEAQAWLIVRDLPLRGIFTQMAYEGTPALWHLLILPIAKDGAPYLSMNLLHLGLAALAICLWLFKAPFPIWLRGIAVFSYFLFWEYAVIARSYGLSVLLMFAIAAAYPKRFERPLAFAFFVALLFQANVHSFFLAAGVGALFAYEAFEKRAQRRDLVALLLIAISAALAVWQLMSPPDNLNYGLFAQFNWKTPFFVMGNAFFPGIPRTGYVTMAAGYLVFGVIGMYLLLHSRRVFFVFATANLGLMYVFVFKHAGTVRHHGLVLFVALLCLWLSAHYEAPAGEKRTDWLATVFRRRIPRPNLPSSIFHLLSLNRLVHYSLGLSLLVSVAPAVRHHFDEYTFLFSGSRAVAEFLLDNNLEHAPIAAYPSHKASAVLPYLPRRTFWYADVQADGSFVTWNTTFEANRDLPLDEVLGRIERAFAGRAELYVMLDALVRRDAYTLLFQTDQRAIKGYGEETYYLYRVALMERTGGIRSNSDGRRAGNLPLYYSATLTPACKVRPGAGS